MSYELFSKSCSQLLAVFRLAQTSEVKVAFIFFSLKKGFKKPNYS